MRCHIFTGENDTRVTVSEIPAVFLTYDRDFDLAIFFCLNAYAEHWPNCPLCFYVPVNSSSYRDKLLANNQAAPVDLGYQKEAHQGSVSSTCRRDCKEAAQVGWVSEESVTA
jgi:hypothetical protein